MAHGAGVATGRGGAGQSRRGGMAHGAGVAAERRGPVQAIARRDRVRMRYRVQIPLGRKRRIAQKQTFRTP